MHATRRLSTVKSAVVLFAPSMVARLQNPAFGRMPQKPGRLPIGPRPEDARWWAEFTATPDAPTEAEEFDRMALLTMSRSEYRALAAEIRGESMDRCRNAEEAELAELRTQAPAIEDDPSWADDVLDSWAREAAELAAVCEGGPEPIGAAPAPKPARKPRWSLRRARAERKAARA